MLNICLNKTIIINKKFIKKGDIMKKYLDCPFCKKTFPITDDTFKDYNPSFESINWKSYKNYDDENNKFYPTLGLSGLILNFYKCPACDQVTIDIFGKGSQFPDGFRRRFYPASNAKQFPDYVPSVILDDYEEAYEILDLSPKASATLSRRCIQGMIRDRWKVEKRTLFEEIDAIKEKIDSKTWEAINAVRQIGNIGAHMEKDINLIVEIDPYEAEQLIILVELLIKDWYIDVYEREKLLEQIVSMNKVKQKERRKSDKE